MKTISLNVYIIAFYSYKYRDLVSFFQMHTAEIIQMLSRTSIY